MTSIPEILINDARRTLLKQIDEGVDANTLQGAFVAWAAPSAVVRLDGRDATLQALAASGAERTYQHVAVLGFAKASGQLKAEQDDLLRDGIMWICQRDPVVAGTPMGFCMDGVALTGILLGANGIGDAAILQKCGQWIQRCRSATLAGSGLADWQESLVASVCGYTGITWESLSENTALAAEVRVALQSKGIVSESHEQDLDGDEEKTLLSICSESSSGLDPIRATLRLAALDWIRRTRPIISFRRVTVPEICSLLRRVGTGFKRWTWESKPRTKTSPEARKWHIENEYHVQNVLWAILAPIFPDLSDEDATPKVGPVQPRADICVPSLRVIIEIKFMRSSDAPKKMIEQIAEDASLYLVEGSNYDEIIAFIWDDSRRSEHHEEMIRGLRQIDGITDAIIVSRPGSMTIDED